MEGGLFHLRNLKFGGFKVNIKIHKIGLINKIPFGCKAADHKNVKNSITKIHSSYVKIMEKKRVPIFEEGQHFIM